MGVGDVEEIWIVTSYRGQDPEDTMFHTNEEHDLRYIIQTQIWVPWKVTRKQLFLRQKT